MRLRNPKPALQVAELRFKPTATCSGTQVLSHILQWYPSNSAWCLQLQELSNTYWGWTVHTQVGGSKTQREVNLFPRMPYSNRRNKIWESHHTRQRELVPKTEVENVLLLECSNYLKCLPYIEPKYTFLQLPFGSRYSGLKNHTESVWILSHFQTVLTAHCPFSVGLVILILFKSWLPSTLALEKPREPQCQDARIPIPALSRTGCAMLGMALGHYELWFLHLWNGDGNTRPTWPEDED